MQFLFNSPEFCGSKELTRTVLCFGFHPSFLATLASIVMSTQKVKKTKKSSRGGKSSSTYLSAEGLHNLKYYRYSGTDKSLLANLFLKRHWDWCTVTFFPIWMAPNLITLCGLICIVANMISLLYYCPNTVGCVAPSWVYALAALGVYAYQIFDNIDGRQARRTGTSSPLGELFDHGCDSLFVPFAGVLMFNAMHLGPWTAWAGFWATAMPFFMAHWEEYHTGELILGVLANPTEGQFVMCALLLTAAIKGPAMWSTSWKTALGVESLAADLPDLSVTNAILGLLFIGGFTMAFVNTVVVLRNVKKHKSNLLRSLLLLFPLAASGLSSTAWFHLSKINLLQNYTTAAIFFAGLQFSYILNRMLIARITRTEYNVWNPVPLLPIVGPLFCTFLSNNGLVSELQLFYGVLGVTALIYVHFVCDVVGHLADHLGISCFTIPYPKRKSVIAAVAAAKKAD